MSEAAKLRKLLNDHGPRKLTQYEIDRNKWVVFGQGDAPKIENYDATGQRK